MESTRGQERLTPDNAALLLIDHQVGLFTGVRDIPVAELKHNVVALAKALKVLSVPIIVTATSPEMWGPVIPELTEALPGISIINRTTVNAFDDARFAKAVEATGRKKLIIAGVSTEVCLAWPAIFATGIGYDAYAVIDASGTFSETKRITGLLRMVQAGVIVTDYCTVAVEMLKDNANPKAGALYGALDMPFAGLVGQLASRLAMAAPMLREPPVTSATLPVSFFAMFVFIFFFQMSFSNCESGIAGCVSRRNCLTGQGRGCRGVFHEPGEMFAVAPEQEQRKQRNHNRHRQSRRCHQDVEAKDVHDYRTKQSQT